MLAQPSSRSTLAGAAAARWVLAMGFAGTASGRKVTGLLAKAAGRHKCNRSGPLTGIVRVPSRNPQKLTSKPQTPYPGPTRHTRQVCSGNIRPALPAGGFLVASISCHYRRSYTGCRGHADCALKRQQEFTRIIFQVARKPGGLVGLRQVN